MIVAVQHDKIDKNVNYDRIVRDIVKKYRRIEIEQRGDFVEEVMKCLPVVIVRDENEKGFSVKKIVKVMNSFLDKGEITYKLQYVNRSTKDETISYRRIHLRLE